MDFRSSYDLWNESRKDDSFSSSSESIISSNHDYYASNESEFGINSIMNQSHSMLFNVHDVLHHDHRSDLTQVWILSLICSSLVGLTGLLPFIILPKDLNSSSSSLKLMLAFSVGALLGDIFLHLLPEAWSRAHDHEANLFLGIYVVMGLFSFTMIEIMFADRQQEVGDTNATSDSCDTQSKHKAGGKGGNRVTGYLNVMANGIDNFSHGLAVAASFLVAPKIGFLTTLAILLHEVPHEFGDYAILMKSGFSTWQAAKAQASTASIGLLGAAFALTADASFVGNQTDWMLPFTAGGFIHIALVSLLPDLIRESDALMSLKQVLAVAAGVLVMALVNCIQH